jgi:hypothetical protein
MRARAPMLAGDDTCLLTHWRPAAASDDRVSDLHPLAIARMRANLSPKGEQRTFSYSHASPSRKEEKILRCMNNEGRC